MSLPPHRFVLKPLLDVAVEVSVRGRILDPALPVPPAVRKQSVLYLDLTRDVLTGWEWFWNANAWARGAILITVPRQRVDWATLFSWTEYTGVWASRWQIAKGTPRTAISHADKAARGEAVIISLSASNGIEHADVWSDPGTCRELDALARAHCRRFVRACEVGKYEREIVVDRPPYLT